MLRQICFLAVLGVAVALSASNVLDEQLTAQPVATSWRRVDPSTSGAGVLTYPSFATRNNRYLYQPQPTKTEVWGKNIIVTLASPVTVPSTAAQSAAFAARIKAVALATAASVRTDVVALRASYGDSTAQQAAAGDIAAAQVNAALLAGYPIAPDVAARTAIGDGVIRGAYVAAATSFAPAAAAKAAASIRASVFAARKNNGQTDAVANAAADAAFTAALQPIQTAIEGAVPANQQNAANTAIDAATTAAYASITPTPGAGAFDEPTAQTAAKTAAGTVFTAVQAAVQANVLTDVVNRAFAAGSGAGNGILVAVSTPQAFAAATVSAGPAGNQGSVVVAFTSAHDCVPLATGTWGRAAPTQLPANVPLACTTGAEVVGTYSATTDSLNAPVAPDALFA